MGEVFQNLSLGQNDTAVGTRLVTERSNLHVEP